MDLAICGVKLILLDAGAYIPDIRPTAEFLLRDAVDIGVIGKESYGDSLRFLSRMPGW